ncbi:MAG: tetratricopeptide repeat protein [Kofleriaceae bacterium]
MAEEERTRRWQKSERYTPMSDMIGLLRNAITAVRKAPADLEARRQLRAIATEQGMVDQVTVLMLDEARAHADRPEVAQAFWEELADLYENLDQPLEVIAAMEQVCAIATHDVDHLDRLAWLYRKAGAWQKAAETFERVGLIARDDRARAAMRAAGKLYRDNGRLDRSVAVYRAIVEHRPTDAEAWRALDDLLAEMQRWEELADVRGHRARRAASGVEKAALLRAQARALEQAGDLQRAAQVVKTAANHAPDDLSGLVDYADVLARSGQSGEAADILRARVREAIERGAPADDIAALRLRLAGILEDRDPDGARAVLDELLEAAPEYLPALERFTAHAAADPDPRVHAAALLRYAAALPDEADRSAYVVAAGRRYLAAGDHRGAVRAFEQALELSPDDEPLRRELDDARTSAMVEKAAADAQAGDAGVAERRLRQILQTHRHHIEANLALVEILAGSRRLDAAAEHLRDTLSDAPDDTPEDQLARLVLRLAQVMAQLGDDDEAHQLLHDAHRLDRRSLPIALALGESCFARKLWRQAALHLGAAADHPDAARHAPEVAAGLVRAAQAEIRALRPQNANRHYETAVRIDPSCAPAWHALAEAAIERGDLATAADHLEREASATTAPKDRLRLFDALGDMALDVLGDDERAERCWQQVAGIATVEVLSKLIAVQRKHGPTAELAANYVRIATLSEPDVVKSLLEEAATTYAAAGLIPRAMEIAADLMSRFPRDPTTVAAASNVAMAAGDAKRAATWLEAALSAREASGTPALRAELWRRLGDAQRDLDDEAAAVSSYERAVASDPGSEGAMSARRALVELASTTGKEQHSSLIALVEAAQDPFDVLAWARSLARSEELEDARAAFELARAIGARLTPDDEKFLAAHPARVMASDEGYASMLDLDDRGALVDDDADGLLGDVFALLGEAMPLLCPNANNALIESNFMDAKRLPATSDAATAVMYPQIVKVLGGPPTMLYSAPKAKRDITLLLSSPPVVVVGPRLASQRAGSRAEIVLSDDSALRFQLGRIVELSRPSRIFAGGQDAESFALFVAALRQAFGPAEPGAPRDIVTAAERLRTKIPVALRSRLSERLASATSADLDPHAYRAACERAADRAGMIACGDIATAVELAGGATIASHLVKLGASQRYLGVRKRLRRVIDDTTSPFQR